MKYEIKIKISSVGDKKFLFLY